MAREGGNPNIAKLGQDTQFGKGQDAATVGSKAKPWAVRRAAAKIAAHQFDISDDAPKLDAQIRNDVFKVEGNRMRGAELVASRHFLCAASGTDKGIKAIKSFTDDVDGKLIQKSVEAKVTLEMLVLGSFEEEDDDELPEDGQA